MAEPVVHRIVNQDQSLLSDLQQQRQHQMVLAMALVNEALHRLLLQRLGLVAIARVEIFKGDSLQDFIYNLVNQVDLFHVKVGNEVSMDLRLNYFGELKHALELDSALSQITQVLIGLLVAWVFWDVLLDLAQAKDVHIQ